MQEQKPCENLLMFRPDLDNLPPLDLPGGVTLRHIRPEEGPVWTRIASAAFPEQRMDFETMMRADLAYAPERVLLLEERGEPVATASAWRREEFGPDCGYVHWVAALPSRVGKGYGYLVSLAALHRMRDEGCLSAVLHTQDARVPAIRLYLKLGFHICMDHPTLPARWAAISKKINKGR